SEKSQRWPLWDHPERTRNRSTELPAAAKQGPGGSLLPGVRRRLQPVRGLDRAATIKSERDFESGNSSRSWHHAAWLSARRKLQFLDETPDSTCDVALRI